MATVVCGSCGGALDQTYASCPSCGAARAGAVTRPPKRNLFKLIGFGFLWIWVSWIGALIVTGFVVGAMHPQDASEAGRRIGAMLGPIYLLGAICLSVVLTVFGKLPGTGRPCEVSNSGS